MLIYILRRVLYSIPLLLIATFGVFLMVSETFDASAYLAQNRSPETRAAFIEKNNLDEPVVNRYGDWLVDAVQGNFGETYRSSEPVMDEVRPAFWNTIQIVGWGILISAFVAVSIGVYSAVRQYSISDYLLTGLAFVGIALPPFWFGLIAYHFATELAGWVNGGEPVLYGLGLHSAGKDGLNLDYARHLVLPVMTLTVQIIASWSRFQRSSMLDVLSSDYIRTARAKGVSRPKVILKHGLRNGLIPLVTIIALDVGALFGGLVVTEVVFSIPGMGRLFVDALNNGEANIVLAWLLIAAFGIILFNLLADIAYSILDPRIRLS